MASSNPTRVAVITGAARGIGRSIALRLADDGLDVVINDLVDNKEQLEGVAEEVKAKGRRAAIFIGDVSEDEAVKALIQEAVKELGGVDVMVANAGIGEIVSLFDTTSESWDRMMRINTRGPMLAYKYAAEQMIKQGRGGRIIGASSICGKRGIAKMGSYCASKFAVRGLTQSSALELKPYNITVNAYSPGLISTPMTSAALPGEGAGSFLQKIIDIPGSRYEEPEVIASLVSYIAKPEAHFITGQTITADGGNVFD